MAERRTPRTSPPTYDAASRRYEIAYDDAHRNRLGQVPLWGASGFGNFFNQYVWAALDYQGRAFLGTFDAAQLERAGASGLLATDLGSPVDDRIYQALVHRFGMRVPREGADLLYLEDGSGRAWADSLDGLGNDTSYGVRTMLEVDGSLLLGMANGMNLHPRGGWELLGARARPTVAPSIFLPLMKVRPR